MTELALVTPGCSCCLSGCAQRPARTQGCAGQPGPQTGLISADVESPELQALPFGSFLVSVVRGQGFHGNWKADRCDPLREGLRASAAQTSQPLPLVLVSLWAEAVPRSEPTAVGRPHLNSPTLSPGVHVPFAFYTITCTHSESHPSCPGGWSGKRLQIGTLTHRTKIGACFIFYVHIIGYLQRQIWLSHLDKYQNSFQCLPWAKLKQICVQKVFNFYRELPWISVKPRTITQISWWADARDYAHIGTGLDVAKTISKKVKGIKRSRNMPIFLRFVVRPQRGFLYIPEWSVLVPRVSHPQLSQWKLLFPQGLVPNQGLSTKHGGSLFTLVLPFCYLFVFIHEC